MFNKGQLAGLMKKAQEMQENMKKAQDELLKTELVGESGAGLVKITINGKHDVKKVTIDESVMNDKEMLEDLVAAAINDANRKFEKLSEDKLGGLSPEIMDNLKNLKMPF